MTEMTGNGLTGAIKRKHIARILHEYLRYELHEADETNVAPAYILQDLFDCRVCAGHIIQVYVKGIMDGVAMSDGRVIFDAEKEVSEEEMADVLTRTCFPELRTPHRCDEGKQLPTDGPEELSFEQVTKLLQDEKNILLVDVRTERMYEEKCLKGAVNAPFLSLIKNPFMFSEHRNKIILLYCGEGYQSKAAAQCLLEAGYNNVAFFSWNEIGI